MENNIISREITLRYPHGSLNPIDINEHFLQKVGIIDENNKLNRGMLRIGSLGTNIIFSNETKDEIRVQSSKLKIESNSAERIEFILEQLKEKIGNITPKTCEYRFDAHLTDERFPNAVFSKFVKTDGLKLQASHYMFDDISLVMYSCGKNRIHIMIVIEKSMGKQLVDFNLKVDMELDKTQSVFNDFISNDIRSDL